MGKLAEARLGPKVVKGEGGTRVTVAACEGRSWDLLEMSNSCTLLIVPNETAAVSPWNTAVPN